MKKKKQMTCLICNTKLGNVIFKIDSTTTIYQCHKCQRISIITSKKTAQKQDLYSSKYYLKDRSLKITLEKYYMKIVYYLRTKFIANLTNHKKITLLDIGCGDGMFIKSLNPKKILAFGNDLSKSANKICLKKGIRMISLNNKNISSLKNKFDVITMYHVFEHLSDPTKFLSKIKTLLKKNAYLIFVTPNTSSIGFRYGLMNWFHLDPAHHIFLYNKEALVYLLSKCKIKIVLSYSELYDCPLDLFWSIKKFNVFFRILVYIFYPFIKFFSKETKVYVCQKNAT